MKSIPSDDSDLRKAICEGRAVLVAGTGVSIAASVNPADGKPHPQASWAGLLEDGLMWIQDHGHMSPDIAAAHRTLLNKNPKTHHFITAAHDIVDEMGGVSSKHYAEWLKRTVGSIEAYEHSVPLALEALHSHGNLMATTNYDDIMLAGGLKPVTWKDPKGFLSAARNKEKDNVMFLHGHWQSPESVVLDWRSYEEIARNEQYRQDLVAIWKMTTWVYVGCGMNGLNDPDFGLLLERYGNRARDIGHWDYCLVRKGQRAEFQAHFDKLQFNIRAVSFGDEHADLATYLHSLLPAANLTPGTVPLLVDFSRVSPPNESIPVGEVVFSLTNQSELSIKMTSLLLESLRVAPLNLTEKQVPAGPIDTHYFSAAITPETKDVELLSEDFLIKPGDTEGFFVKIEATEAFTYNLRITINWHFLGSTEKHSSTTSDFELPFAARSLEGLTLLHKRTTRL